MRSLTRARPAGTRPVTGALALVALVGATVIGFPASSLAVSSQDPISIEELTAAPINLPEWGTPAPGDVDGLPPCPTTGAVLRPKSERVEMQEIYVAALESGDVDRDGTPEAIARLDCVVYQAGRIQVVAFDRTASGSIVVLGQVVRQGLKPGAGSIRHLTDLSVTDSGQIGVVVADRQPCCGAPEELGEYQQRWYGWLGGGFVQIGGPTSFHPIPSEYGKPAPGVVPLSLGPAVDGIRRGSTIVRIYNPGPASAPGIRLEIIIRGSDYQELPVEGLIAIKSANCAAGITTSHRPGLICHLPEFPAGVVRTLRVAMTSPTANDPLLSPGQIEVNASPEQPGVRVLFSEPGRCCAAGEIRIS